MDKTREKKKLQPTLDNRESSRWSDSRYQGTLCIMKESSLILGQRR